jgi:beta-phosphoglucomutase family hydrolase
MSRVTDFLDAAVFDLDGVVTFTARVHAAAWSNLFDTYLAETRIPGADHRPFSQEDYHRYVDGRPRYDGVNTFLHSRGISLPYGMPSDSPDKQTVCGLGNRKEELFLEKLQEMGLAVDNSAVALIRTLREHGVQVGVASSSKNTSLVLEHAHLSDLFQAQVDGIVSERLHLKGKPQPDIFLTCLHQLGISDPVRAMVTEDAVAGVQAARAGGFGFVLGVDRGRNEAALHEAGADVVISSFASLSLETLEHHLALTRRRKETSTL